MFAHVPLWAVYPQWGWGTHDGAQALGLLKRFGSVTVLNGHIHQIAQKVEGQHDLPHRPLDRPSPSPRPAPRPPRARSRTSRPSKLRSMLGLTSVDYVARPGPLALIDWSLR